MDYKKKYFSLLADLTLCDHIGDVANAVTDSLAHLDINDDWEFLSELHTILEKKGLIDG